MNIGPLIPQIFYDIIARLAPGFTLLATCYVLWTEQVNRFLHNQYIYSHNLTPIERGFLILFLSYFITFPVEGILWLSPGSLFPKRRENDNGERQDDKGKQGESSHEGFPRSPGKPESEGDKEHWIRRISVNELFECLWERPLCRIVEEKVRVEAAKGLMVAEKDVQFPSRAIMYDAIRLKNPGAGANLVKLRAEIAFCRTLLIGWALIWLFRWIERFLLNPLDSPYWWSTQLFFLPGLILAFASIYAHRTKRLLWSYYDHWLILMGRGKKKPEELVN